ncbi:hypothetical protein OJJOAM_002311 [Cupriavidus sp. H18C1]
MAARIAHRHRLARRRAACAHVDRVMRRRNALPFANAISMPRRRAIDAPSTLDDDRRGRSATQWTGRSVSRSAPLSASRFLAIDHAIDREIAPPSTILDGRRWSPDAIAVHRSPTTRRRLAVGRWRTPAHACTHAPTAYGHAQISLPPARAQLLTSAVGPAAPAADGRCPSQRRKPCTGEQHASERSPRRRAARHSCQGTPPRHRRDGDRQRPRVVRLHGLQLLRGHHRPAVLSDRQRPVVAVAGGRHLRRRLLHAPGRRHRARRLCRPRRPQAGAVADHPADGAGHHHHRHRPDLRPDRRVRAAADRGRAADAGASPPAARWAAPPPS